MSRRIHPTENFSLAASKNGSVSPTQKQGVILNEKKQESGGVPKAAKSVVDVTVQVPLYWEQSVQLVLLVIPAITIWYCVWGLDEQPVQVVPQHVQLGNKNITGHRPMASWGAKNVATIDAAASNQNLIIDTRLSIAQHSAEIR